MTLLVALLTFSAMLLSKFSLAQSQLFPELPSLQACTTLSENITCPDNNIKFFLFSGSSTENETMNLTDLQWLSSSKFNKDLPTVFLIHGFSRINGMEVLRDAYLQRGTHNIIIVEWVYLAQINCYMSAVNSLKGVAKCVAHSFAYLEAAGVDATSITCIGHSLGAHICGLTTNYRSEKLQSIVALDPARPLMQTRPVQNRLDESDANVVQVLHSSAGYYGMSGMVGTADFCINNGLQPYCRRSITSLLCSHFQSICFFAESLDPTMARNATPCRRSCPQLSFRTTGEPVKMGANMDKSASGMYCLTAAEAPYCKNEANPIYGDTRCCP